MAKVILLDDHRPHITGPAKCLACGHKWEAVVLKGAEACLECPECSHFKGEFIGEWVPKGDAWMCRCENMLFFREPDGSLLCPNCGRVHTDFGGS